MSDLYQQTIAARNLLLTYQDILSGDDEATASAIEGETNLREAIGSALARHIELNGLVSGIEVIAGGLAARKSRLVAQMETLRTAIMVAMEAGRMPKIETPLGVISLRKVAPKVIITNEADIPVTFWKPQDPKLDKAAVAAALKSGETVAGAEMSNGGTTIAIKVT
jgi:hypothetical protein